MRSNYKRLGDYIHAVDERNTDLQVNKLVGLSMTKEFRDSTSNIIGTDMSVYKILKRWQFACDFMSVIRVHKLPVVLKYDVGKVLVSPAYAVFEVNNPEELDPEYLMMWFRRSEFDRYADFKCDSAIRGGYDWAELCNTEIPIPSIEKQREIVKEYNVILDRIKLNNQLIVKLEESAQAIYKQWFVDFEFPDENGKPYKSSGGEMVWCEKLEMNIPKGWDINCLSGIASYMNGIAMQNYASTTSEFIPVVKIRELSLGFTDGSSDKARIDIPNQYIINNGDIIFSWSGTLKVDIWAGGRGGLNQHLFKVTSQSFDKWFYYLWTIYHLNEFIRIAQGKATSLGHIKREHLQSALVLVPSESQLIRMGNIMSLIIESITKYKQEYIQLLNIKGLILSKLAN